MVINEFAKHYINIGVEPDLTFWRDNKGNEIDLIQNAGVKENAYEIKSGMTASPDYFKGLKYWAKISGNSSEQCFAIYSGSEKRITSNGILLPFNDLVME